MKRFCCLHRVCLGFLGVLTLGLVGCAATTAPSPPPEASPPAETEAVITNIATETLEDAVRVLVDSTGPLQYTAFKLPDPPRLVVDISQARLGMETQPIPVTGALLRQIEPATFNEAHIVRLTLHLQRMASHTIDAAAQQLQITLKAADDQGGQVSTLSANPAAPMAAAPTPPASTSATPAVESALTAGTVVTGITFVSLPETSVLAVQTSGKPANVRVRQRQEPLRLSLEIADARLQPGQEKVEMVSDPGGAVTELRSVQVTDATQPRVQIVAHLRDSVPFEVRHDENLVRVMIRKPTAQTQPAAMSGSSTSKAAPMSSTTTASSMAQQAPSSGATAMSSQPSVTATASAPGVSPASGQPAALGAATIGEQTAAARYVGEKISLDFQDADINDILRLIAEVSGLNVIAGGDVQGRVTTRMVDVPWDQALDVVLRINGLAQERDGNIIRIAPLDRFISERQERARARQTEDQSEPTVTQLVPVNYATASELQKNLERLLSDRGSIFIDERTNTLIITDTRRNLDDMLALVETLDRQTPQVMIEARIVETSRNFLQDLGVQLGFDYTRITDVKFPNRVDVNGSASPGNFLVDLPAAVTTGSGGAISFALAGASNLLNLRLSALERSGRGKIISNPKVATLDNTEALIQSGRRIPVQTVSAEGTQTEFVDASLSLKVTPHVTPDGFINMKINATKNEADFANAVNGVPSITTREATTEMLVKDSDTVVIGGLYRRTISEAHDGVPGLSRVPVLGWMFQKNQTQDDNDELLIFITPRIIRQPDRRGTARVPASY